jgi:hypothetical protein
MTQKRLVHCPFCDWVEGPLNLDAHGAMLQVLNRYEQHFINEHLDAPLFEIVETTDDTMT